MSSSQEISNASKAIRKKSRYPADAEADKKFDELKRKYANAVAYMLVKNVRRPDLQQFFSENEDNQRRFETIKKFRQAIVDSRPKARIWVDKPFYVKLDLGEPLADADEGSVSVPIILGGCKFKQHTSVVQTRKDLEAYMETIAKIIDSERVWADPDMADFDIGERDYHLKSLSADQNGKTTKV